MKLKKLLKSIKKNWKLEFSAITLDSKCQLETKGFGTMRDELTDKSSNVFYCPENLKKLGQFDSYNQEKHQTQTILRINLMEQNNEERLTILIPTDKKVSINKWIKGNIKPFLNMDCRIKLQDENKELWLLRGKGGISNRLSKHIALDNISWNKQKYPLSLAETLMALNENLFFHAEHNSRMFSYCKSIKNDESVEFSACRLYDYPHLTYHEKMKRIKEEWDKFYKDFPTIVFQDEESHEILEVRIPH